MKMRKEPDKEAIKTLRKLNSLSLPANVRFLVTKLTNELCEKQPIKHDED